MGNNDNWLDEPFYKKTSFIVAVGVLAILIVLLLIPSEKSNNEIVINNSTKNTVNIEVPIKERLKTELNSFKKPFDNSSYRGNITSLQIELVLFSSWRDFIKKGKSSIDKDTKKLAGDLESKVVALQTKEFPFMRKEYAKILRDLLWENDIDISINGSKNTIINVTGGAFAANKNIQEMQNNIVDRLKEFRFKQSQYRWYKRQDKFQYYTIETPKDNELVRLN